MLIGVPKEIKNNEYRVGITPAGVRELVAAGHQLIIESNAGTAIGLTDQLYQQAGAEIVSEVDQLFARADMIVKVKEPQALERTMLRSGQILFTYLHLAPDYQQTTDLMESDAICIAYETVTDELGGLPLLAPMSEVAGRMAMGLGADVTIVDRSLARLKQLDEQFGPQLKTLYSTKELIEQAIVRADLIIGAVLVAGASAPKLVTRDMLAQMKEGAVLVDVAIDQGGCFESSHATTHETPTYVEEGIIHYCVTNMPGAVARTSTFALTNATLPFVLELANKGIKQALQQNAHLRHGLNIYRGKVTYKAVAEAHAYEFFPPESILKV